MMLTPRDHQLEGALFLASHKSALLADDPRVGKTGAALIAADYVLAHRVLVITTATGRPNWQAAVAEWSDWRKAKAYYTRTAPVWEFPPDVMIIGWPAFVEVDKKPSLLLQWIAHIKFDVVIVDEAHYAMNIEATRTKLLYNYLYPRQREAYWWALDGTPTPRAPVDLFPFFKSTAPELLGEYQSLRDFVGEFCVVTLRCTASFTGLDLFRGLSKKRPEALNPDFDRGWPQITDGADFTKRYGYYQQIVHDNVDEFLDRFKPSIDMFKPQYKGGKNVEKLRDMLKDRILRRTQADIGIRAPYYSTFMVHSDKLRSGVTESGMGGTYSEIIAAAEAGDTNRLDMALAELRHYTGDLVARLVAPEIEEQLIDGLDKIVLMCWHTDVIDYLKKELAQFNPLVIDGRSTPAARQRALAEWPTAKHRVMLGQIKALGENADLSAACNLMFVELSFSAADMKQASLRITNMNQKRQCLVRVCALEGSIYEAIAKIVVRKSRDTAKLLGKG